MQCSVSVEEARIGNLMNLVNAADGQWSDKFGTKGSILSTAKENKVTFKIWPPARPLQELSKLRISCLSSTTRRPNPIPELLVIPY